MLGFKIDNMVSGFRPSFILKGFSSKIVWRPGPETPPDVKRGLRAFRYDGAFASISDNLAINFFEIYLVMVGGGSREVGTMTAVANLLGVLSLWPGVMAIRLWGKRLPVVLYGGAGIGRLMLLALAIVPFAFPTPLVAVPAVIAFNGVRVFMSNFSNPAWTAMVADLVPEQARGPYFASRNSIIAVVGAVATLASGWIVAEGNSAGVNPLFGYSLLFTLSFVAGMFSTFWFSRVPDYGTAQAKKKRSMAKLLRGLLRYPLFLGFLGFTFLWNFALYVSGPFFNVYMVKELHAAPAMVGFVSMTSSIVQVVALPYWGRKVDTIGDMRLLVISGFLVPLAPLMWMLVQSAWQPSLLNIFSGFVWAGFNLANFNLLLKMMPEEDRQDGAAIYQALVLASTVLGPILGAEIVEDWGYKATFAVSAVLRYVSMAVLVAFVALPLKRSLERKTS